MRKTTETGLPMNKKLSGKVALVTGGTRGIGAAIARSLAEDGADVVISYVSSPDKAKELVRELQTRGVRAAAFQADQANPAEVAGLVRKAAEHFGHLDILVNNAGVFITGPVGEVNDADVARQFAINVGGVNAAVREAAKLMAEGGRIISIGSMGGTSSGNLRLLRDQGRRGGIHARLGARSRTPRHHGQRRRAGSDRHRHESR
jgi:3-oxoacyl-[acyl-carrier protein] reductase